MAFEVSKPVKIHMVEFWVMTVWSGRWASKFRKNIISPSLDQSIYNTTYLIWAPFRLHQ
jgi:hypothetical protein